MGVIQVDLGRVEGKQGPPGQAATIRIGTVTAGDTPQVINTGSPTNAILNFVLPGAAAKEQAQTLVRTNVQTFENSTQAPQAFEQQETQPQGALLKQEGEQIAAVLEGVLEACDTQTVEENVHNLLSCFQPMKGVDEKGIVHYGFLAGKAEQNLRAMGQDPETTGLIRYEQRNESASRAVACEELLALTVQAVLALRKQLIRWEEEGRI